VPVRPPARGVRTGRSRSRGVRVGPAAPTRDAARCAAFGDTAAFGLLIALAIAIQNIPEGLAISLVLVPRGISVARAAGWSIFSSLPQPLMAVPAYQLVEWFKPVLPFGLGFAGGAMLWMVAVQLVPDALRKTRTLAVAGAAPLRQEASMDKAEFALGLALATVAQPG